MNKKELASAPPAPQAAKCATCNGNGLIGGQSFYAPDEGGVPCPDCSQAAVVQQEPLGFISPKQVELIGDPECEFGKYIPMRKTPAGNFTLALYTHPAPETKPIDMVLHCPKCGRQHIDAPEEHWNRQFLYSWENPPHRSHLCHGCGHIWRPADVPTNGVQAVKTKGKADSPLVGLKAAVVQQEPVAYVCPTSHATADGSMEDGPEYLEWADEASDYEKRVGIPLYTHPAQQAKPQPLSDEQFQRIKRSLFRQHGWDGDGWDQALKEAVEAAHGIKGE